MSKQYKKGAIQECQRARVIAFLGGGGGLRTRSNQKWEKMWRKLGLCFNIIGGAEKDQYPRKVVDG